MGRWLDPWPENFGRPWVQPKKGGESRRERERERERDDAIKFCRDTPGEKLTKAKELTVKRHGS